MKKTMENTLLEYHTKNIQNFQFQFMKILELNLNETSNVQTLYENFTNLVFDAYHSGYPMIGVEKKKKT